MLRGTVTSAFVLSDRDTAIALQIDEGSIRAGDTVRLELGGRTLEVSVRAVEFVDFEVGRPGQRAEPAILVDGVEPAAVPPGTRVSAV